MNKSITLTSILLLTVFSLQAQELKWAGKRLSNTSTFLDPNEVQMFGSITNIEYDSKTEIRDFGKRSQEVYDYTKDVQYVPFGFGGDQSIVSKTLKDQKAKSWEIYAEVGVTTQFEWRHVDTAFIQRNHMNSDFRIAFSYARTYESSSYRIRFFHVSSHLGDDFIIRHGINRFTPTKMNYEQADVAYFKTLRDKHRLYASVGSVIRPQSLRLPFMFMAGGQSNWKKDNNNWGWTAGLNLKAHQETDFYPNIKVAAGPAYFSTNKDEPIRVVLEYYMGHLPYSQYEIQRVYWFGAGVYFYI